MALTPIDQYKYGLKKYLAMHFQEVEMNRGQKTTSFFFYDGADPIKLEIDNTEIESCQKANTMPKAIKELCK